jgi:hypothetical protein
MLDPFHPVSRSTPGAVLKKVFFNGGPQRMSRNVPGTDYIGYAKNGGLDELNGSISVISYTSPDYLGGRLVISSVHPETKFPQFLKGMADYAWQRPHGIPRNPIEAGTPVEGISGDRQYQYKDITVPEGCTELKITLTGMDGNCDLLAEHGMIPRFGKIKHVSASKGNKDETLTIKKPKPGTWFVGVYGNHTILNGAAYSLSAVLEQE